MKQPLEPRGVIEDIRKGLGIGVDATGEAHRAISELQSNLHNALERLSKDLYSKETHFVLELLQNAEDNRYATDVTPLIRFVLAPNKIIVQNNEIGFTEANVRALCRVGHSTKSKIEGYIGEKGIGFKSVFRISHSPHVISAGYRFRFSYEGPEDKLGVILPHWIEESELPEGIEAGLTNIILPLQDRSRDRMKQLDAIRPALLLFLKKLKRIEIRDDTRKGKGRALGKEVRDGVTELTADGMTERWRVIRRTISRPSEVQEEKRAGIPEAELALAFPIEGSGKARVEDGQQLCAFLPVCPSGLRFIVQGDFLLLSNRENVHEESHWNRWLRDEIPDLFLEAVEAFKDKEGLRHTFYTFIPLKPQAVSAFLAPVVGGVLQKLRQAACILTEGNEWVSPGKALRAEESVRELFPAGSIGQLIGMEYVSSQVDADDALDALGVEEFDLDDALACLAHEEWVNEREDRWFRELYCWLGKQELTDEDLQALRGLRIIRLEGQDLASIADGEVFLSRKGGDEYGFEHELRIVKKSVLATANVVLREDCIKFLQRVGAKLPSPAVIIERYILPDYENNDDNTNWFSKDDHIHVGHLWYIRDNLAEYLRRYPRNESKLQSLLWVQSRRPDGMYYLKPNSLYLSVEYGGSRELESLLASDSCGCFVDRVYFDTTRNKAAQRKLGKNTDGSVAEKERDNWKVFLLQLGVEDVLRPADLLQLIASKDVEKVSRAWKHIDRNWSKWKKNLLIGDRFTSPTQFCRTLRSSACVPTESGALEVPGQVYLRTPLVRSILGEAVDYVGVEFRHEELAEALEIRTEPDIPTVLDILEGFSSEGCVERARYEQLYRFLSENYEGNEGEIKEAFRSKPLIFLPEKKPQWMPATRVFWKDVRKVFGQEWGYLEKHYSGLRHFFADFLRVKEVPQAHDYAQRLLEVAQRHPSRRSDKEVLFRIYEGLSAQIRSASSRADVLAAPWWEDFATAPILWTDKGEFRRADETLFLNDDEELWPLFKRFPGLSTLDFPRDRWPKARHLLGALGIRLLSECITASLHQVGECTPEDEATSFFHFHLPHVAHFYYHHNHDAYLDLVEREAFRNLESVSVLLVSPLQVEYGVAGNCIVASRHSLLQPDQFYIDLSAYHAPTDMAVELARFLGSDRGVRGFLYSLFERKTPKDVQALLGAWGIPPLPNGEVPLGREMVSESVGTAGAQHDESRTLAEPATISPRPVGGISTRTTATPGVATSPTGDETSVTPSSAVSRRTSPGTGNAATRPSQPARDSSGHATIQAQVGSSLKNDSPSVPQGDSPKDRRNPAPSASPQHDQPPAGTTPAGTVPLIPECSPSQAKPSWSLLQPHANPPARLTDQQTNTPRRTGIAHRERRQRASTRKEPFNERTLKEIGRHGEEVVLLFLKNHFTQKYPGAAILDMVDGFGVMLNGNTICRVCWHNYDTDTGQGYDITVNENGAMWYVEVKSTVTASPEWFQVSRKQWACAKAHGDSYFIYRVSSVYSSAPNLLIIQNPVKLWSDGHIEARAVSLLL